MPRTQQRSSTKVPAVIHAKPPSPVSSFHSTTPQPGFGQLIKEGIGFGIGQSIANRAVSAVLGPATVNAVQHSNESKPICVFEKNTFDQCLRIKTQEDHCNNEHLAYTQCLELNHKSQ